MKVVIIDDHTLFREGLQGLLERHGIEIVASIGNSQDGIKAAQELNPDVLLLDLRMPEMGGLEILEKLQEYKFKKPVVMLTTSDEEKDIIKALKGGASGYLLKDMEPDELVAALRDIVAGDTVVAPNLAQILAKAVQGEEDAQTDTNPIESLTPREFEILELLAEGQSNKVIARNLGISDGTVKLHVKAILRKLDIHSRVEAAVMAVEHGIRSKKDS